MRKSELKALQTFWYAKLKDTGFEDVEDSKGRLKQYDRRAQSFQNREQILAWFNRLSQFLAHESNLIGYKAQEIEIMSLYCDGNYIIDIAKRFSLNKDKTRRIVEKYKTMLLKRPEWNIRPAREGDIPFIMATWLNSYRYDSAIGKTCRNAVFFDEYSQIIAAIMAGKHTKTLVACMKEDDDILFGYAVFDPQVLHYVFVKEAFSGFGIAKSLVECALPIDAYTHKTECVDEILRVNETIYYNPFLLWRK